MAEKQNKVDQCRHLLRASTAKQHGRTNVFIKVIQLQNDLSGIISSVLCSELLLLALRKSCRRLSVLAAWHGKEFFQSPLQRLERWPLDLFLSPAFQHDLIESLWTAWWTGHPIAMFYLM